MELDEQGVSVFGVYPGPIQTDMTEEMEVKKESPADAARRVFDGMEEGVEEITTDSLSDAFKNWLKADESALEAVERRFS